MRKILEYKRVFGLVLLVVFFVLILIMIVEQGVHIPYRESLDYDTTIVIDDRVNLLQGYEREQINQVFKKFQGATGITPMLIILDKKEYMTYNSSIIQVAKQLYAENIEDDKHCLFVYIDGYRESFGWIVECGKACEPMLNSVFIEQLNDSLRDNFSALGWYTHKPYRFSVVLIRSVEQVLPLTSQWFVHKALVGNVLFLYCSILVICLLIVQEISKLKGNSLFRKGLSNITI